MLDTKIRKDINFLVGLQLAKEKKESNGGWDMNLFKSSFFGKMKTSHKNGNQESVDEALDYLKKVESEIGVSPIFTAKHGIWKLISEDELDNEKPEKIISNQKFEYMMLSRLKGDVDYFLNNGNRSLRTLREESIDVHISAMKKIYNSIINKPEWLSMEEILELEKKMKSNRFEVGDFVNSSNDYVYNGKWVGIIMSVINLDGKFSYKINSFVKDTKTGEVINDSEVTNKKQEDELKPFYGNQQGSGMDIFFKLSDEYSEQQGKDVEVKLNQENNSKVKSAKKYKDSTTSDAFDFVKNIQTYSFEVIFEDGKSWYGNAVDRNGAIELAIAQKYKTLNKIEVSTIEPLKETSSNEYFKGIDSDYKNQFTLNKAIEQFLDSKDNLYIFSNQEKEFLYLYEGYGGLEKEGATGKELLWEYYTPKLLIKKMWGLANKYGFNGGKVLEPSVGVGRFLNYSENSKVTAYEISRYSHRICQIIHPLANVNLSSFEEHFYNGNVFNPNFEKDFDLVIGNPPYGDFTGKRSSAEAKRLKVGIKKWEHYFILRGLDTLKSGGLLIYVSTANLFTKGYDSLKEKIAEKGDLVDAYLLPNKTFKKTTINTSLIVIRKKQSYGKFR